MDMLLESDSVGGALLATAKAHFPQGVQRRAPLSARHDNQDWQLSFTFGPFDDIEFMLCRVSDNERTRRVLSLYDDGTYGSNIHPANKDAMEPQLVTDILLSVSTNYKNQG